MSGPPPVPGGRRPARSAERPKGPKGPRPAARGPRGAAAPPRTRLTRRGRVVLLVLAALAVAVLWFLNSLFQPFHGDGGSDVTVTIPRESGVGKIADILEAKGVAASAFFFEARATIGGKRGDLKPGTYTLDRDSSYSELLDKLAAGPPDDAVQLVIPEGKSRAEIARSIKSLEGDYLAATKRSSRLDPADYGADGARDLEGFLFPATYELKRGSDVKALVAKQLDAFKQKFATVDMRAAEKVNLTGYDVLIIASLVERETSAPEERTLVASVIYNRLKQGMPLQIDATTRFQYDDWENPITQSQLESSSPYNTRINDGLPPGPIGNPGLDSINAAARPEKTDYLYYVVDCDNPGKHVFVATGGEFDAAVARYNAARDKAGGRAPTSC